MEMIIYAIAYALIGSMFVKPLLGHAEKMIPADFFEKIRNGMSLMAIVIWPALVIASITGWISGRIKRLIK